MKTFCKHIILALFAVIFTQCGNDFLETTPISGNSTEYYFQTAQDAESAIVGCYRETSVQVWRQSVVLQVTSDNNYAGGDNPENFRFDNFERIPAGEYCTYCWEQFYRVINRCNTVLKYVPKINDPDIDENNRREIILGEASFLRAFAYFNLVRIWGDVPLRTTPTETMEADSINLSRTSIEQIYTQIIKDLEFSTSVLPKANVPSQQGGHATQGSAYALLAQVYATQMPADWEKVSEYCDEVISSNVYQLLPDFDQLYDREHNNNSESIFEYQFERPNATTGSFRLWCPLSLTGETWKKFNTPSVDLINAYRAEGDSIRLHSSILWEDVTGCWVDQVFGVNVPFPYKWRNPTMTSDDHFYVIRLSESILLRAEAKNELNDINGALDDLQIVRDRVNLPAKVLSTKEEIRDAILLERRLELAFEFYRWFDLLRTGKAITTMQNLGYPVEDPRDLLFPIPQDARDRNPNLEQNTGYN